MWALNKPPVVDRFREVWGVKLNELHKSLFCSSPSPPVPCARPPAPRGTARRGQEPCQGLQRHNRVPQCQQNYRERWTKQQPETRKDRDPSREITTSYCPSRRSPGNPSPLITPGCFKTHAGKKKMAPYVSWAKINQTSTVKRAQPLYTSNKVTVCTRVGMEAWGMPSRGEAFPQARPLNHISKDTSSWGSRPVTVHQLKALQSISNGATSCFVPAGCVCWLDCTRMANNPAIPKCFSLKLRENYRAPFPFFRTTLDL